MRKLVLFDIDGTLLSTNGAARRAFERSMLEVYGAAGPIDGHDFSGKTDPQIARELLTLHGVESKDIDAGFASLWRAYVRELAAELALPTHRSELMPGVAALLGRLEDHREEVLLGLLTGNIREGADLKLRSVGIEMHFAFGAYGSDSERRERLPAVAVARARAYCGRDFLGSDVIVIGDTPHDVTCGESLGVMTIGVTTGRFNEATLIGAGADHVLADLSDTERVLRLLLD